VNFTKGGSANIHNAKPQGLQHAALSHNAKLLLFVSSGAVYVATLGGTLGGEPRRYGQLLGIGVSSVSSANRKCGLQ
jgi:hypothetical protein